MSLILHLALESLTNDINLLKFYQNTGYSALLLVTMCWPKLIEQPIWTAIYMKKNLVRASSFQDKWMICKKVQLLLFEQNSLLHTTTFNLFCLTVQLRPSLELTKPKNLYKQVLFINQERLRCAYLLRRVYGRITH